MTSLHRFNRQAAISFAIALIVFFAGVHLWWAPRYATLPKKPSFPAPFTKFVAYYAPAGSAEHSLFYYGLFGMGQRLREADVIVMGTSHSIFGVSARTLTKDFSRDEGRPIKVFNMGLVYGEGTEFAMDALRRNGVSHKTLVIDLFSEYAESISAEGKATEQRDLTSGLAWVGKIWSHYDADYLLDAWVPQLHLENMGTDNTLSTRMLGNTLTRRFDSGDDASVWIADYGEQWHSTTSGHPLTSNDPFASDPKRLTGWSEKAYGQMKAAHDKVITMLIPYDGYSHVTLPDDKPVIRIDPKGLEYVDQHHVNEGSNLKVTSQIAQWFEKNGLPPQAPR